MSETIGKLKPGAIDLSRVAVASRMMVDARARLDKALDRRREAMCSAAEKGASHADIAAAAGLSPVRVGQIIGAGK